MGTWVHLLYPRVLVMIVDVIVVILVVDLFLSFLSVFLFPLSLLSSLELMGISIKELARIFIDEDGDKLGVAVLSAPANAAFGKERGENGIKY